MYLRRKFPSCLMLSYVQKHSLSSESAGELANTYDLLLRSINHSQESKAARKWECIHQRFAKKQTISHDNFLRCLAIVATLVARKVVELLRSCVVFHCCPIAIGQA